MTSLLLLIGTALLGMAPSVVLGQHYATRQCLGSEFKKSVTEVRRELGALGDLDDAGVAAALQGTFYPDMTVQDVACSLGVRLPDPPKKLGPIDQWRYDSCRSDAAKAPTARGVTAALQVCREKFGQ